MKTASIIGGGAAGFFAAIRLAELRPDIKVRLYEKSPQVLGKVKVSGGGRCNVTHQCLDPRELVKFYPRGGKSLIGPFTRFGPVETIAWFESKGVALRTEYDGRMFPVTNVSATIVDCLIDAAKNAGVEIYTKYGVDAFEPINEGKDGWKILFSDDKEEITDYLMIATGSSELIWKQLKKLHLQINEAVPSLFTFNIKDDRLVDLLGISFPNVKVNVSNTKLESEGALLITHWGLSGPGILKLSSWGAKELNVLKYKFNLLLNFLPQYNQESMFLELNNLKYINSKKQIYGFSPFEEISKRFWIRLLETSKIADNLNWADLTNAHLRKLSQELVAGIYEVNGKSTYKDEFVTCGGIALSEIDLKRMSSKKYANLYFGGEVMDVDALTGGFNFQNAWTSGWIAGSEMGLSR